MDKIAQIAQIGESVLRDRATPVTTIDRQLVESLIATAIANNGVGIAAPQIANSQRLFIVTSHPSDRYPNAPTMQPTAMINPKIISHGTQTVKDWEGCLSVPNVRGLVPRYQEIKVEYTTIDGEAKQDVLTDFIARIFQHELDHLDGILFVDRVESKEDLYTETEYLIKVASGKH